MFRAPVEPAVCPRCGASGGMVVTDMHYGGWRAGTWYREVRIYLSASTVADVSSVSPVQVCVGPGAGPPSQQPFYVDPGFGTCRTGSGDR